MDSAANSTVVIASQRASKHVIYAFGMAMLAALPWIVFATSGASPKTFLASDRGLIILAAISPIALFLTLRHAIAGWKSRRTPMLSVRGANLSSPAFAPLSVEEISAVTVENRPTGVGLTREDFIVLRLRDGSERKLHSRMILEDPHSVRDRIDALLLIP
jgi:hypothetical protein